MNTILFRNYNDFFKDFTDLIGGVDDMFTKSHLTESKIGTPVDTAEQTETGYVFTVNAAGFKKDDLNISAEGKLVTVQGQSSRFKNKIDYYFSAPKQIDVTKIKATLLDGVLEVEVPFLKDKQSSVKVEIK